MADAGENKSGGHSLRPTRERTLGGDTSQIYSNSQTRIEGLEDCIELIRYDNLGNSGTFSTPPNSPREDMAIAAVGSIAAGSLATCFGLSTLTTGAIGAAGMGLTGLYKGWSQSKTYSQAFYTATSGALGGFAAGLTKTYNGMARIAGSVVGLAGANYFGKKTGGTYYSPVVNGQRGAMISIITPEMISQGSVARYEFPFFNRRIGVADHRGHLLAKSLGGSGRDGQNLIPLDNAASNIPMYANIEKHVKRHVESGSAVYYYIRPNYLSDRNRRRLSVKPKIAHVFPYSLTIWAIDMHTLLPVPIPKFKNGQSFRINGTALRS